MVWTYILECSDDLVVDTRVADLVCSMTAFFAREAERRAPLCGAACD